MVSKKSIKSNSVRAILIVDKVQYLAELGGGRETFLARLINVFCSSVADTLVELKTRPIDSKKIVDLAHKLKGMAGNIGAERLEGIAIEMEECGRLDKLSDLDALLKDAESVFAETKFELYKQVAE